jgi:hypothetical protein
MKFVKLSQNLRKYALNVRSVTLGYAHMYKKVPSIGVSLHSSGEISQNLKFNYLYKSNCKSYEL